MPNNTARKIFNIQEGEQNLKVYDPAVTRGDLIKYDEELTIGGGGTVNSVTATAPLTSSGGVNPNIAMPAATAVVDGYLTAADWLTFNGKQGALTLTTVGSSGPATLIGNILNIPNYAGGSSYTFSTGLTDTAGTITANLSTGVAGGQTAVGGTAASNNLTLSSTSNATKGKILFGTSAYDEVNNRLGIGTQSPAFNIHSLTSVVNPGDIISPDENIIVDRFTGATAAGTAPGVILRRARGSSGSPSAVLANDALGVFGFRGYNGTAMSTGSRAAILAYASENWTATANGAYFSFLTTPDGTATAAERMRIFQSGNVFIGASPTDAGFRLDVNGTARVQTSIESPIHRGNTTASGTLTLESTSNATKGKILFGTSAYDEVNNRLGIGTTSPATSVNVVGDTNSNTGEIFIDRSSDTLPSVFSFRRARNTIASPSAVLANDQLGIFSFRGYDGSSFTAGRASISAWSSQNWSVGANGSYLTFQTTADGSTSQVERMRVFSTGNVAINTPTDAGFRLDVNGTARFQERLTVSQDNTVTTQVVSVINTDTANCGMVIAPSGTGAIMASIPDGTATGGNARGANAVDLQTVRNAATQVASGTASVLIGGEFNTVSGNRSVVIGGGGSGTPNIASGPSATIIGGGDNIASSTLGTVIGGYGAVSYLYGQRASASVQFATRSDAQTSSIIYRRAITGTAQTELFIDGASVRAILSLTAGPTNGRAWRAQIDLVAIVQTVGNGTVVLGECFMGSYHVGIKRIGTATSLVGTVSVTNEVSDTNMSTAVTTITADDTNEALKIEFTPPTAAGSTTVIRVVATAYLTEVGY